VGILLGVAIAATTWQQMSQATRIAPNHSPAKVGASQPSAADDSGVVHADFSVPQLKDLGSVKSRLTGLKGRFKATWSERLGYRLVIEPNDPAQQAAFAHMVSDPPRPLSVGILLKDGAGLVLCSQDVVLKYDPRKAAMEAISSQQRGKMTASKDSSGKILPQAELDRLQTQEKDRESGKDIFENVVGKDGQIEGISSQGTMPCSKEDYASVATWSFTADFPSLDEQASFLNHQPSKAALTQVSLPQILVATKSPVVNKAPTTDKLPAISGPVVAFKVTPKQVTASVVKVAMVSKPAAIFHVTPAPTEITAATAPAVVAVVESPAAFYIEGDDAVIDYDATVGVLETSMGKKFFLDKTTEVNNVDAWADDRAHVHYRCDESKATCTLTRGSAVILNVRTHG
jgi:hypothetical protein